MRKEILLGSTNNNELAFSEFNVDNNGRFTAMFHTDRPFDADAINLIDYAENYLEDLDKDILYDLCVQYDCAPSELVSEYLEDCSIEDFIDTSMYSNEIIIERSPWLFESVCCGQHDLRNEMKNYVNKEVFDKLNDLWDRYHLKSIPENELTELNDLIAKTEINEEGWIKDFIINNFDI